MGWLEYQVSKHTFPDVALFLLIYFFPHALQNIVALLGKMLGQGQGSPALPSALLISVLRGRILGLTTRFPQRPVPLCV